jgi:hypothetical protein
LTVVVGGKLRAGRQFPAQHAARQRNACQNPDPPRFRLRKEQFRGAMPEAVENDLHRLHIWKLDRLQRFFHALHTDSVVAKLPGLHQPVQCAKEFRPVVDIGRRTVKLHQVEAIRGQVAQAVFDEAREVPLVVSIRGVRREAAPRLGGDKDLRLAIALQLRNQPLAPSHAVDIGRVDEVDAAVDRRVQRGERLGIVHISPASSDRPRAKTDLRHLPAGTAQLAIIHL